MALGACFRRVAAMDERKRKAGRSTRVLIVDDHAVVRLGLATVLDGATDVEVVGEAGTSAEALVETGRLKPDVVLMDLRLPDGNGLDACLEIRAQRPSTRVLFLSSFFDEAAAAAALQGRASGYLFKDIGAGELRRAIEAVHRGESVVDPRVARSAAELTRAAVGSGRALSPQERRILKLVADGKSNREIAGNLGLSATTVRNYLSNAFQKLRIRRRSQAAALFRWRSDGSPAD